MSKFKPGDKVVLINVDQYSDIMKQLIGKVLVVNSIDTDKCGCEIVCARVPGEEGWFLYSDDLRLVSETQPEHATEPAPAAVQKLKPLRRGDLVMHRGQIGVVHAIDRDCDYWVAMLTGDGGWVCRGAEDLTRIGSIRKKIKRLHAQKESRNAT